MKYLILFPFLFNAEATFAQNETPSVESLLPLRSCAMSLSRDITGTRFREGMPSDDENSFYFLNCDENYDLGQDHYVFTPKGVYYFFIKAHKDYKGGFEATQFRLSLEGNTYYFKSNVVGGMGSLYDSNGKNLRASEADSESSGIDPTAKNLVMNYYMKVLTGKGDVNSTINAELVSGDRLLKAQACIQSKVLKLATSLVNVYKARRDYRQVSPEVLSQYQTSVKDALLAPACNSDETVAGKFDVLLKQVLR